MTGTHQNQRQVVKFATSGKRADDGYGLSRRVEEIVKRNDVATQRAKVSTARKAGPMAKALLTSRYTIAPSYLTNRVSTRIDGDTLRVDASQLRFPLVLFAGRWGGRSSAGATASIEQAHTKTYSGAFIARGRFRGVQMPLIYSRRKGKKVLMRSGAHKGEMREPIAVNRGPSTYEMILGIETDQNRNQVGRSATGDVSDSLRFGLIKFYISEQRRLRAVGVSGG